MSQTLITSRDNKGRHAVNLFAIEYDKAKLDGERAQRLNERGGEMQEGIAKLITELSVSDRYADEEVKSSYVYLSGYQPKPIAEQVEVLCELFPELGSVDEKLAEADFPPNAEGWFAIPRWEKIAPTYGEAVKKVLDLIKQARNGKLYNCRDGIGSQHERTTAMLKRLGDQQSDHDILVVSAQFGLRHRGRSVRRARDVFNASEFGLGSFQIACMILTHPERLQDYDDLLIDCAGDEYAPGDGRVFSLVPYFRFNVSAVEFGTHWIDRPSARYGSVSGFVPQS